MLKTPLIFDLDGTLVDSVPDLAAALRLTLAAEGLPQPTDHEVTQMVGDGARVLVQRAFAAAGPEQPQLLSQRLERFLDFYHATPVALTCPWPGVMETLETLHRAGHPMAVCTNKPVEASHQVLAALDLDRFFPVVVGGGSCPHLKPHPEPLLLAAAQLGASPAEAVMVGDSPNDSQAARAAGMSSLCVTYGYRRCRAEELGADLLVDHFPDLLPGLEKLAQEKISRTRKSH